MSTTFDLHKLIREAIVAVPVEISDLQVMAEVITALQECEASRIKHGYQKP